MVFLSELSVEPLVRLFRGELDELLCETCGQPLGVQPAIAFRSAEAAGVTDQEGLSGLRQAVAARLRDNLAPMLRVLAGANADTEPVSARSFAAALVALTAPGCGIEFAPHLIVRAAELQAGYWTGIARNWIAGKNHSLTLEEDLARHFAEGVVVVGADERALAELDEIEAHQNFETPEEYCLQAVRASICAAAERSNPKADAWVGIFLTVELESRALDAELAASRLPLLISAGRARATIPFEEANQEMRLFVAEAFEDHDPNYLDELSDIAGKCGHPMLVLQILEESGRLHGAETLSVDEMIEALRQIARDYGPTEVVAMATVVCRPLMERGDFDELERVAAAVTAMMGGTAEAISRVDLWLAGGTAKMGYAKRVIDRIGSQPRQWELELPWDVRSSVWQARARALEGLGRYYEALDQMDELLRTWPVEGGGRARRDAIRFASELEQATGAPALAVQRLEPLRRQTAGEEQMLVVHALANCYRVLGRHAEAVRCREEALTLAMAGKSPARSIASVKATLALELTLAGRHEEAARRLSELEDEFDSNKAVLFLAAVSWASILGHLRLSAEARATIAQSRGTIVKVYEKLGEVAQCAEQSEQGTTVVTALRLRTLLVHLMDLPDKEPIQEQWELLSKLRDQFLQEPSAIEVLALADLAYARGEVAAGREYLVGLPLAMAASVPGAPWGGVAGLGHLAARSQDLAALLNPLLERVKDTVISEAGRTTVEDLRLIGEIRREALGRAQSVFRKELSDLAVARLVPKAGRTAVVELLPYRESALFVITIADASGEVTARVAASPEARLAGLARRMEQRLSTWRLGRPGDPLDVRAWQALERWLRDLLGEDLTESDHVVFIESGDIGRLPWHVAVAGRWTASYTTSWARLLSLGSGDSEQVLSVGVARVPQFHESDAVLGAMRSSAERTRSLAAEWGVPYVERAEQECDRRALAELLAGTTAVKLLCHGFVSPAQREVALMVAHDGALPPGVRVSTDSQAARTHRFGWRECRELPRAPQVVFSAACSTGISHTLGMGEHLGLYAGLASAGTRAMVAPRWDVVAASVLPILDDALERYAGGAAVGAAVDAACRHAEADTPRWLAWALATTGDWTCRSHLTSS
jgi:tetratricopeptide (TPR) repeat protein